MELYQMQYVLVLAEELNFSKAADRLCVTQPAISKQIKRLEDEIGIKIFERDNKTVKITATGQEFIARVRQVYSGIEDLQVWISGASRTKKIIRLGVSEYVRNMIEKSVNLFQDRYSNVEIRYVTAGSPELLDKIRYDMIDIAIVDLPDKKSVRAGLNLFNICDVSLKVIMSPEHELAKKKKVPVEKLKGQKILLKSNKTGIYYEASDMLQKYNVPAEIEIVPELNEQFRMMHEGGIAFGKIFVKAYTDEGFIALPVDPGHVTEFAVAASGERRLSVIDKNLIQVISECIIKNMSD